MHLSDLVFVLDVGEGGGIGRYHVRVGGQIIYATDREDLAQAKRYAIAAEIGSWCRRIESLREVINSEVPADFAIGDAATAELAVENAKLREKLRSRSNSSCSCGPSEACSGCQPPDLMELQSLVDRQAEDEGLWFLAKTCAEAYLQQELRKLHAAVENVTGATLQQDDSPL